VGGTHRLFKLEQLLFLSKNQVISIHVISFRGLLSRLGVHHALGFLVDRKVAFMRTPSGDALEIPVVRRVTALVSALMSDTTKPRYTEAPND
jgi:hypothetical protein